MAKTNRQKKRTRELLQTALIELIREREYGTITIQDIVDRADLGRTTFYQHFHSKEELFISCHEGFFSQFYFASRHALTREELLSLEPPPGMVEAYKHLADERRLLYSTFQSGDGLSILRQVRDRSAKDIESNLRAVFAVTDSAIPIELLANYLAGAQIALVQWWLEKRRPHTAENIAQTFHRLQRAAIRDTFNLKVGE